jgi:hypothetical protein
MNTLSPRLPNANLISRHTSAQSFNKTKSRNSVHFNAKVELVSGDNGNYQVAIIHRDEAMRLFTQHKARIPEGYHRRRNIAKLFLQDYFPKQEKSNNANSSKTTFVQRFVVTPGSQSPRFALGRSIMGILIQHKPILSCLKDLYSVRQVG